MRNNDFEKILINNNELCPSESLKKKVYDASSQVEPVKEHSKHKILFIKKLSFIITPVILLIICCFLTGIVLGNESYCYIYIDVNPSVEIVVNRFDYIVDVNYLNEDDAIEYVDIVLKSEKIEEGLNNFLDKLETEGYLENKEMIISVVAKNNSNSEEILKNIKSKVNNYITEKGKNLVIDGKTHSEEEKIAAEEHNLSPAKYKLIEYVLKLDETRLLDDLKNTSIEDLAKLLFELSGEKIEEILDKPFYPNREKPFGDVDFDSIKIDKLTHNFVNGICTICGEKDSNYEEIHTHTESDWIVVNDATCTTNGKKQKMCTICNEVLIEKIIDKLEHTIVKDEGYQATCTESGLTEGSHCSICNELIIKQEVIEKLGHTEVIDAEYSATCTEPGLTEGSHCSICDEVLKERELIAPIDHEFVDGGCITCNLQELEGEGTNNSPTVGLIYMLNIYGTSYSVKFNPDITDSEIVIAKKYRGLPVTNISNEAFKEAKNIKTVIIPSSVTSIGENAFSGCENLINITIPNSVTSIGKKAFKNCKSLEEIKLSENINKISDELFSGCVNLETIEILDSVTSIGALAFENCINISNIVIPNSVKFIGLGAFKKCAGLEKMTIPFVGNVLYSVSNTHFGYIFGATEVIDNFGYVPPLLKEVEITGGTSIPGESFSNCIGIEKIVLSDSITSIGASAFSTCANLVDVTLSKNLKDIRRGAFSNCVALQNIIIPNSVTIIEENVFSNCTSLISIEIPNSVQEIGRNAFYTNINTTIYCEISEQPDIWNKDWDKNIFGRNNVVWGYKK